MALTYDPKDVQLNFGDDFVSGYADGTFIVIAFADPERYKSHEGADGEQSRTKNNKRYGTVTFRLKSTSPARVVLDAAKELGAVVPCWVKNNSDQKHLAGGPEAWIANEPEVSYGEEEEMVEYVIGVRQLRSNAIAG